MQLIRAFNKSLNFSQSQFIEESPKGIALTIGNFDGVHLGHQTLINNLKKEAGDRKTAVMIFEPQPLEFFSKSSSPARLTHFRDKVSAISALGIDYLFCFAFNDTFAKLTPKQFIEDLLIKKMNVSYLLIGDDFKFGAKREGNFSLLQSHSSEQFVVKALHTVLLDNNRISSTAIREALSENHFDIAEKLLGRPFSISGRVMHGDKVGSTLGFATANLAMKRTHSPVKGVYAVKVDMIDTLSLKPSTTYQSYDAIANIGYRPTVNGKKHLLEVNIFNFQGNLYGKHLKVTLKKKIRDEKMFANLEALRKQIALDIIEAQYFFKKH